METSTAAGSAALLGGDGGGSWTVLVPSAVAAEWTALALAAGRARAQRAAGNAPEGGPGGSEGFVLPEVFIDVAALVAESCSGRGAGEGLVANGSVAVDATDGGGAGREAAARGVGGGYAGGPCFVPIIFIHNKKAKKDKVNNAAKVIFGVLILGSLAMVIPVNNALQAKEINNTTLWQHFGSWWGLLSIGFHFSLAERPIPRAFTYKLCLVHGDGDVTTFGAFSGLDLGNCCSKT